MSTTAAAEHLLVAREEGVLRLTLNRPDSLNSLTPALLDDLRRQVEQAGGDDDVRCVVLTGSGRAFSSGQAIKGVPPIDVEDVLRDHYNPLVRALRDLDKPVIAAINGFAMGAAASLTLSCDLRVMADDARLAFLFVRIGLVADAGATWHLPRLVGPATAFDLLSSGEDVPAARALELGLVQRVVPAAELDAAVDALARRLATGPAAIGIFKRQLRGALDRDLDAQLEVEVETQAAACATSDYAEGKAAFAEKRPAAFTGR